MSCSPTMCMAGGAPKKSSPKASVSQIHDVMTILHQQMLSNQAQSKDFAKTILQFQTATKRLQNPMLKYYAQQALFIEKQAQIKAIFIEMEKEVKALILTLRTKLEEDEFDEFDDDFDIQEQYGNLFNTFNNLEELIGTFTKAQQAKIHQLIQDKTLHDKVLELYRTLQRDPDVYTNEFVFELLNLRRMISTTLQKVDALDALFEKPMVKSASKPTTPKKRSIKKTV